MPRMAVSGPLILDRPLRPDISPSRQAKCECSRVPPTAHVGCWLLLCHPRERMLSFLQGVTRVRFWAGSGLADAQEGSRIHTD